MNKDFSQPQKQSASGIVVLFVNTLQKVVRAIALPILFIVLSAKDSSRLATMIIAGSVLLIVILAIFTYIKYQRFSFFLDAGKQEFVINEGVFNRSTLTIQLSKIQQVNISQSLLQQLAGVYSLDIDTAGSEKKEASIKAIDQETAIALKQRLLDKGPGSAAADDDEAAIPFLNLSIPTLLKVGITSNYGASLALLAGFMAGLIQLFRDYTSAFKIKNSGIDQVFNRGFTFFSVGTLIAVALLIILATNITRTMIKYFNFQILKQKDALVISAGLFTRKNILLKPGKVQLSAYSQNYFQKKFNFLNIKIKQATYDTGAEPENRKDLEIPGCDQAECNGILKLIYQQVPVAGLALTPNYRFILLQAMRWVLIPVLLFLWAGSSFYTPLKPYFVFAIPYALIAGLMLYFEFKRHRLYVSDGFIIKRSGIWDVRHEVIEPYKIQAISTRQYFWQQKANLGHLSLHTAAGAIHFKYGNYTQINRLVNFWTYQVESTKKEWN